MKLTEHADGEMVRTIRSWVYREMSFAKGQGLSKTQFTKAVRIAMQQYTKIAIEETDKFEKSMPKNINRLDEQTGKSVLVGEK